MNRISFGIFGLFVLAGVQLGSIFGAAVALFAYLVLEGIYDELRKRHTKK